MPTSQVSSNLSAPSKALIPATVVINLRSLSASTLDRQDVRSADRVRLNLDVLLRNEDGYAIHRETGELHRFDRTEGGWQFKTELEAPEVANQVWESHRLAELKSKEDEEWKAKATTALKEVLGMVDGKLNAKIEAFESAFKRIEEAQKTDPTIYPFARQRRA